MARPTLDQSTINRLKQERRRKEVELKRLKDKVHELEGDFQELSRRINELENSDPNGGFGGSGL